MESISVDWNVLESEWYERNIDTIRNTLVRAKVISDKSVLIRDEEIDRLSEDEKKKRIADRIKIWEKMWEAAFETHDGAILLAYFVFVWGMSMWELTSDHEEVRDNVAYARDGYLNACRGANQLVDANDAVAHTQWGKVRKQKLVYLIFNKFTIPMSLEVSQAKDFMPVKTSGALLLDAMSVESAVYSGSLVAAQTIANAIKELCENVLKDDLIKAGGPDDGICGLLRKVLEVHRDYYGCIAGTAKALEQAGRADPDAESELNTAIAELATARQELGDDVYASELPAYDAALNAWLGRLERNLKPVTLDSVNITYIYPFALSGMSEGKETQQIVNPQEPEETLEANKAKKTRLGSHRDVVNGSNSSPMQRPLFGGLPSSDPDPIDLTDMWTWGGRREELNPTVSLPMPKLTVKPAYDDTECVYGVEFRFNDLGNHYLRVDQALTDPTLNDIHQALRRATPYGGHQDITSDGKPWATISAYADDVITDVTRWIATESKPKKTDEPVGWRAHLQNFLEKTGPHSDENEKQYKCGFNPDLDYHVVVVIQAASVPDSDGSRRQASKEEIEQAYGPLLLQLLNRETTTLEEWICWDQPKKMPNLLGNACFPTDFAIGTESTTVLYMPSTPSWSQSGYVEVAEFSAAFPPLMREWKNYLDDQLDSAERMTQTDKDSRIDDQEKELERLRSGLHRSLEGMRKARTYLFPAQLLSLRAEGAFLEQLYKQSKLPAIKDDVDSYLERGRSAIDRLNQRETRLHDHRNRKYQDIIQLTLFILSIFSFSGVMALFFTLWYGPAVPGWDPDATDEVAHHSHTDMYVALGSFLALLVIGAIIVQFARRRAGLRRQRHHA